MEIVNSSYLAIKNLLIDSGGIAGLFGISAKDGASNLVHDILIEGNTLVGQNGSQQTVGISTKTQTWGWTIRRNVIDGAGTGLYLGNSDGTLPFFCGTIENNLIENTIGYNMQVKHQLSRPLIAGMPTASCATIIRNNVFIKNDQPSPDGDRPNLLLGGFPGSGFGSTDLYDVYGNLFYHNPREALFQGEGRLSLHDNIFIDGEYAAATLRTQNLPLAIGYFYNNTIYTKQIGVYYGSLATIDHAVYGNLIFAATPVSGSVLQNAYNIADTFANAGIYVNTPSFTLGLANFYPLIGKVQGTAIDMSRFVTDPDYDIDFNGTPKTQATGSVVFRGAYAGEGTNPGWQLQSAIKPSGMVAVPYLIGVQCNPTTLTVGQVSSCSVLLSAAAASATTVTLSSNNAAISVPGIVSVPAGSVSAPFTATANSVNSTQSAAVTAMLDGRTASVSLSVNPPPSSLASVQCNPTTINTGLTASCSVSLSASAAAGTTVSLSSTNSAVSIPAAVTVQAGFLSASFSAVAANVSSVQTAIVNAVLNGITKSVTLRVNPALVGTVQCNSSTITSGQTTSCLVSLVSGVGISSAVALSTSNGALSVPSSVIVPAGSLSASFNATANAVSSATPAAINASLNGSTATANLTVGPAAPMLRIVSLSCSPLVLGSGSQSNCLITLNDVAPVATAVTVTSSTPAVSVVSPVSVAAGSSSAIFTATAAYVTANQSSVISASLNGTSATVTIAVKRRKR